MKAALWSFDHLDPLSYNVIIADPAPRFETWSAAGENKSRRRSMIV